MTDDEKLFSRISHDLRNSFMGILGYSRLLSDPIEEFTKEEVVEFASNISEKGEETLSLLEKFIYWLKLMKFDYGLEIEKLNLYELSLEIIHLNKSSIDEKKIRIEKDIDESIIINVNEEIFKSVFNNTLQFCIHNIVSSNKSLAIVSIEKENYCGVQFHLKQDNISLVESIREFFETGATKFGTDDESNEILDLHISKKMIELSNGEFIIEYSKLDGLSIKIFYPIK